MRRKLTMVRNIAGRRVGPGKAVWGTAALCLALAALTLGGSALPVPPSGAPDRESIREALASIVRGGTVLPPECAAAMRHFDTLRTFYRARDFEPLWTGSSEQRTALAAALRFLSDAGAHGLPPAAFATGILENLVHRTAGANADPSLTAALDFLVSDRLIDYARDLSYGVANPRVVNTDPNFLPLNDPSAGDLFAPLRSPSPGTFLANIQPTAARYRDLQEALRFYREVAARSPWTSLPVQAHAKIEVGGTYPAVRALVERIAVTHPDAWKNFRRETIGTPLPDDVVRASIRAQVSERAWDTGAYDSTVAALVRDYQSRNGLLADGVLGERTLANLNRGVEDRILQIRINLDRMRWMSFPDSGRYVLVNIPDFTLAEMRDDSLVARVKVCAGAWYDPRYYTPLLHGRFSYITLNPSWYVPSSIVERELYPEMSKNPDYLRKRNYKVLRNDTVVPPSSIDWKKYSAKNIPFRIVQDPGEGNALGKIKFGFFNPFDIYLHDTPKRRPFLAANRGVSHGCVRVEEPYVLLRFLTDDRAQWSEARVREYLASSRATKTFKPERIVDVYIDYFTTWVDEDGVIQFREDVYGRDRRLKKAFLAQLAAEDVPSGAR